MILKHSHVNPPTVEEIELKDVIVSLKVALALSNQDLPFLSAELSGVEDKVIGLQKARGLLSEAWYESLRGYPPTVV